MSDATVQTVMDGASSWIGTCDDNSQSIKAEMDVHVFVDTNDNVQLLMRIDDTMEWAVVKTYTVSTFEIMRCPNQFKFVRSSGSGNSKVKVDGHTRQFDLQAA